MNEKRLMFICHGAGNGGAERVISTLAGEFSKRGYKTALVTTKKENNQYSIEKEIKRYIIHTDAKNAILRTYERVKGIRGIIKSYSPEAIISFSAVPNMQVLVATRCMKRPTIIISERTDPNRYPETIFGRTMRNMIYHLADKIVFQTDDAMKYFGKLGKKKGIVIPNPIRDNMPDAFVGKRKNRIIGVGSLGEQKNWIIALKAAIVFFSVHPEYTFDIYGIGPLKDDLQRFIDSEDILRERVCLKGFSDNVIDEVVDAKMFVSSSAYEGIPNAMLESMAVGTPTIYTDCPVGGPRTYIETKKNGVLVPVNDINALANAMIELADNEELCDKLTKESVKIKEVLKLSNIVEQWESCIKKQGD